MLKTCRIGLPVICLLGMGLLALSVLSGRDAFSYPDPGKASAKWEYSTATVDSASLQAKLEELGNDGWEVFSIERSRQFIEQDPANKTRLVADQYQVTGRRQR
ncbi:MAG: hypothetical protein ACM3U2_15685 [Deltaproteobacteria bacterium]